MRRELLICLLALAGSPLQAAQPNILWISFEDSSANLGCYGDPDAITPNIDKLAARSIRYTHAFSAAPVCAPSRSSLITGVFASSLGSHFMRCQATLPDEIRPFPTYLRSAGYYCSNNVKEDYNFKTPPGSWDESSRMAHWRKRKPGQPFFSVMNYTMTHESQYRTAEPAFRKNTERLKPEQRHDPEKVAVPPFHPDTPTVRRDWARVHDLITALDYTVADLLAQLDADGLTDDTIVFFFSDHGVGLPRGKRWLYDTGIRVPLLVHFPKKWEHLAPGKPGSTDRLVSFVDFGPTVLSLADVKIPGHMQGVPFLGAKAGPARTEIHAIRDRMDERNDCSRAVREARYKYIRNFQPWKAKAAEIAYMNEMPTMREYRRLAAAGKLTPDAAAFMAPTKPPEELYDLEKDPHELRNLAESKEHQEILDRLRKKLRAGMIERLDLALVPESILHDRAAGKAPYTLARSDKTFNPVEVLWDAANLSPEGRQQTQKLNSEDPAVLWWETAGCRYDTDPASLRTRLKSPHAAVRVLAADGLLSRKPTADDIRLVLPILRDGLKDPNPWVRHTAAESIDALGKAAAPALDDLKKALDDKNEYVVRVVKQTLATLGAGAP